MKKFCLAIIIAVVTVCGFATPRALAMPDVTLISNTCVAAQLILNQIQKVDTGSRINRGHDYTEMLNLMFAMNARLSVNKIAAPALVDLASQFEQNLAKFRADYDVYDDVLSKTIEIKCASKPIDFYNKLEESRAARNALWQDVELLKQNMNDYLNQFDTVIKDVKQ
jgi:hypothetical protein